MSAWRGCEHERARGMTMRVPKRVARAATKTDLVAPNLLRYVVESLYNAEAQFLPLLIFIDDNIFNMPHQAEIVYAVAPNEKTSEGSAHAHTDDTSKLQGLVTTTHERNERTISAPRPHSPSPPLCPPRRTPPVCSTRPRASPSNRSAPSTRAPRCRRRP